MMKRSHAPLVGAADRVVASPVVIRGDVAEIRIPPRYAPLTLEIWHLFMCNGCVPMGAASDALLGALDRLIAHSKVPFPPTSHDPSHLDQIPYLSFLSKRVPAVGPMPQRRPWEATDLQPNAPHFEADDEESVFARPFLPLSELHTASSQPRPLDSQASAVSRANSETALHAMAPATCDPGSSGMMGPRPGSIVKRTGSVVDSASPRSPDPTARPCVEKSADPAGARSYAEKSAAVSTLPLSAPSALEKCASVGPAASTSSSTSYVAKCAGPAAKSNCAPGLKKKVMKQPIAAKHDASTTTASRVWTEDEIRTKPGIVLICCPSGLSCPARNDHKCGYLHGDMDPLQKTRWAARNDITVLTVHRTPLLFPDRL